MDDSSELMTRLARIEDKLDYLIVSGRGAVSGRGVDYEAPSSTPGTLRDFQVTVDEGGTFDFGPRPWRYFPGDRIRWICTAKKGSNLDIKEVVVRVHDYGGERSPFEAEGAEEAEGRRFSAKPDNPGDPVSTRRIRVAGVIPDAVHNARLRSGMPELEPDISFEVRTNKGRFYQSLPKVGPTIC